MTKRQREIRKAADEIGLSLAEITWTPIGPGSEMCGPSGGWRVIDSEGCDYLGYNVAEVIADMRSSVRYRAEEKERERHYRRGVRSAAREKDARIAELVSALPRGCSLAENGTKAVQDYNGAVLRTFVVNLYRETHRQTGVRCGMGPDAVAVPPSEVRDIWTAIDVLMTRKCGDFWRDMPCRDQTSANFTKAEGEGK